MGRCGESITGTRIIACAEPVGGAKERYANRRARFTNPRDRFPKLGTSRLGDGRTNHCFVSCCGPSPVVPSVQSPIDHTGIPNSLRHSQRCDRVRVPRSNEISFRDGGE
jgi:hypothetical protein